jgi:SAM-dependent methyltransferase
VAGGSDFPDLVEEIFPPGYELTYGVNELYELRLARLEAAALSPSALRARAAYFARILGKPTNHFLVCTGSPLEVAPSSSMRLRTFFEANQFKTGYATHGLFPYRGKFHPQMIKGLINVLGVEPGEVVVDPMMGSGTVLVEASLMGIDSVGVDTSPLCLLMTQAKVAGLRLDPAELEGALEAPEATFDAVDGGEELDLGTEAARLVRLAHLDALGFAARRKRKGPRELFATVIGRYAAAVRKFHAAAGDHMALGAALPCQGDARSLPLRDASVHGVIFSPPYSFAVDYVANDADQLQRLEVDQEALRQRMIGLRGEGLERVDLYFRDMATVMREVARVLRPGRRCCVVVGSNTKQLARLLGRDSVAGIEDRLVDVGLGCGLSLRWRTTRQVTGIANTMRDEHILVFEAEGDQARSQEGRQLSLL